MRRPRGTDAQRPSGRYGIVPSVRCIVIALAAAVVLGCGGRAAPGAAPLPDGLAGEVHALVNGHRAAMGLDPLGFDTALTSVAWRFSTAMARGDAPLEHVGFAERAAEIARAIPVARVAENLGVNNRARAETAQAVVASWLRSPPHRRAIEGPYDLTGIGVVAGPGGMFYFTQIFATRRR